MSELLKIILNKIMGIKYQLTAWAKDRWIHRTEMIKKLRFTTLDKYLLKTFAGAFIISLILFVSIYQLTQIFNDLRWLPQGVKPLIVIKYYFFNALYWIMILQPFSFLFATVYVLSRMAQTRELVAIISTGTSIYRVTFYLIVVSVIYYLFMILFFQNAVIFPAYQKKNILGQVIFHRVDPKAIDHLKDNNNFSVFGSENLIYIVGNYNAISKEMLNVTIVQLNQIGIETSQKITNILDQNNWLVTNAAELSRQRDLIYPDSIKIAMRIDADKGVWNAKDKIWKFYNGTIRRVEDAGESFIIHKFEEETFNFIKDPPYYFEKVWYPVDAMTYQEGRRFIAKLKKSKQDYNGSLASNLSKFSYSLGIIFVVLAGIGIIDMSKRKISFIFNLMLSMLVFVVYYLFFSIGISLAGKGNVPPEIGAYTGAFIFSIMSIIMYRRVKT